METIRYEGKKIHIGCGGTIVKRRCLKCGNREEGRDLGNKIFGKGPLIIKGKDIGEANRKSHRDRIREGRDIFR